MAGEALAEPRAPPRYVIADDVSQRAASTTRLTGGDGRLDMGCGCEPSGGSVGGYRRGTPSERTRLSSPNEFVFDRLPSTIIVITVITIVTVVMILILFMPPHPSAMTALSTSSARSEPRLGGSNSMQYPVIVNVINCAPRPRCVYDSAAAVDLVVFLFFFSSSFTSHDRL
ncbi:hypothetical protein CDD80_6677 [Ophiocordyceps camponoti-rufipedis]|uniref:Uncharacterized protein n=1 Tax=Ophiocordyceps camponoti-rufipedis TaxID=2004952 RepID=A0A2C5ZEW9_9HYPO|nr:hypothetical protein CDD80_6677 [Ophiocordyceps camponoti-rufipedis]